MNIFKQCITIFLLTICASNLYADYPAPMINESDEGIVYVLDYTKKNERLAILKELIKEGSIEDFKEQGVTLLARLFHSDLEDLINHCMAHIEALEIAYELHTNPQLYDLIVKMNQEIKAMPAQPKPQPGQGFIPNLYKYVDAKNDELKSNPHNVNLALHERALDLLPYLRNEVLKRVLTMKEIMADKTDEQIDAYILSEKERLHAISAMIEQELETWEYFEEPDLLDGTDGRCGFRKKISSIEVRQIC